MGAKETVYTPSVERHNAHRMCGYVIKTPQPFLLMEKARGSMAPTCSKSRHDVAGIVSQLSPGFRKFFHLLAHDVEAALHLIVTDAQGGKSSRLRDRASTGSQLTLDSRDGLRKPVRLLKDAETLDRYRLFW